MRKLWSTVSDSVLGSALHDLLAIILLLIAYCAIFPKLQEATRDRHHNSMDNFTICLAIGVIIRASTVVALLEPCSVSGWYVVPSDIVVNSVLPC